MDVGAPTAFSLASRPMKYALSFAVFYCSFSLGIFMTVLGPALNDFVLKFDSTIDEVGTVGTISLVAYLVGASAGGAVYNFVNRQIIVIFLLAAASTCLFLFPYATSLTLFFVLAGIMGFGGGGFDTAQAAWIIDIWRHEAGPFILSQHLSWSVGSLVPPLLFVPFLSGELEETMTETTTEGAASTARAPSAELFIPFTVAGCLVAVAVLIQVVLYTVFQRTKKGSQADTNKNNNNEDRDGKDSNVEKTTQSEDLESIAQPNSSKGLLRRKILVVVLACCFSGFNQAMEQCTTLFLPTYATRSNVLLGVDKDGSEIHLTDKDGARILLGYNVGFVVGRALGVVTILKIPPQYIIAVNFILVLAGNTLLLAVGASSLTWMWIGSICLGLGFSTMFPSFYAYLEKKIFVSDTIAAMVYVSAGLVSSLYPLIVKKYVEDYFRILNYMDYVGFVVCLVSFVILFRVTRSKNENIKEQQD